MNTLKVPEGKSKKGSIFSRLENLLKLDTNFEDGLPVKFLPYLLFLTAIGIFYIGNNHYAEKTIRKIDKIQVEVEDLKADYTTLKADYMFASKQSEVAKRMEQSEIYESLKPPFKIVVEEGEY